MTEITKVSKVKSAVPNTDKESGLQREFKSQHGTIYYYKINFENGDWGEYGCMKKDTQDYFVAGREVEYIYIEEEKPTKTGGKWTSRKIKRPNKSTQTTIYGQITVQSDLKAIIELSIGLNQKNAIDAYIAIEKEPKDQSVINGMALKYHEWCIDMEQIDRDSVTRRCEAIANVVKQMKPFAKLKIATSEDIIKLAKELVGFQLISSEEFLELHKKKQEEAKAREQVEKGEVAPAIPFTPTEDDDDSSLPF